MVAKVETRTVTLRVTPRHRSRLDILTSYLSVQPSKMFADYIDNLWQQASQNGKLQNWLDDVSGQPLQRVDSMPDETPSGKMRAVNL